MKTLHFLLIMTLLFGFTACQEQDETVTPQGQPTEAETVKERRSEDLFPWTTIETFQMNSVSVTKTVHIVSEEDYETYAGSAYLPQIWIPEDTDCIETPGDCTGDVVITKSDGVSDL